MITNPLLALPSWTITAPAWIRSLGGGLSMQRGVVKAVAVITLAVVLMTGCETVGETVKSNPKATIGAAGGATVGGLIAAAASANRPRSPPAWSEDSWSAA
jgi:hypothetical protein